MTINERVSDERLNIIKSWRETYGQDANVMIPASEAESIISELQQYRAAAEPVAWTDQNGLELLGLGMPVEVASKKCGEFYVALYASPQVTSVHDKCPKSVYEVIYQECEGFVSCQANAETIWNACRAAMLQGCE